MFIFNFFPARCYAYHGNATVSRPSVRLSVCNIQVPWSHRLKYFENNFTAVVHCFHSCLHIALRHTSSHFVSMYFISPECFVVDLASSFRRKSSEVLVWLFWSLIPYIHKVEFDFVAWNMFRCSTRRKVERIKFNSTPVWTGHNALEVCRTCNKLCRSGVQPRVFSNAPPRPASAVSESKGGRSPDRQFVARSRRLDTFDLSNSIVRKCSSVYCVVSLVIRLKVTRPQWRPITAGKSLSGG